jgi:hypothetical protein
MATTQKRLNEPVSLNNCIWEVCFTTPWGGEKNFLDREEVERYNADPDAFAARHFGFSSADEYREWIETGGYALCGERARHGRLCRKLIGGGALEPAEWKQHHRSAPCSVHGGRS